MICFQSDDVLIGVVPQPCVPPRPFTSVTFIFMCFQPAMWWLRLLVLVQQCEDAVLVVPEECEVQVVDLGHLAHHLPLHLAVVVPQQRGLRGVAARRAVQQVDSPGISGQFSHRYCRCRKAASTAFLYSKGLTCCSATRGCPGGAGCPWPRCPGGSRWLA